MIAPSAGRLREPAFLLATWFGAGLLPKAPGTWGSLAALPFAWIIVWAGGWQALLAATAIVFLVGCWAAREVTRTSDASDPGFVVIDEIAGQWLVLAAAPLNPFYYAAGFVLFRLFDIWKPWPASWADRRVKGGLGVMLDDLLAALYGLIILAAARFALGG